MKISAVIILSSLFFTLNAAGQKEKTGWEEQKLKGKVKSFTVTGTYRYQKTGTVYTPWEAIAAKSLFFNAKGGTTEIKFFKKDGSLEYRQLFDHDEKDGYITKISTYYSSGDLSGGSTIKYDGKGRRLESQGFEKDGSLSSKTTYTYDGNSVEELSYNKAGALTSTTNRTFDDKGNQLEMRYVMAGGNYTSKSNFVYDSKSNQIEILVYLRGTLQRKNLYKYDAMGNAIEEEQYKPDGSLHYRVTWKYEYDKKNNWTKKTEMDQDGNEFSIEERAIVYY